MTALQKVALGTPPSAVDGDTVRNANIKVNANVDVLNQQATLTSFPATLIAAQALTAANHLGKRVNINLPAAGTINLPVASTCVADSLIFLRNLGTTVVTLAITAGSGDTIGMTTLNGLESALFDTDGVHAWNVLVRGRGTSANETVNGNSIVQGNETVAGALSVTGNISTTNNLVGASSYAVGAAGITKNYLFCTATVAGARWGLITDATAESGSNAGSNFLLGRYSDAGVYLGSAFTVNRATGAATFSSTPTVSVQGSGLIASPTLLLDGGVGYSYLGLYGFNHSAAVQIRQSNNTAISCAEFINYNQTGYASINASAFTVSSDAAFKTEVTGLGSVMPKLRNKRGVSYILKASPQDGRKIGIIAQEWLDDFPELVNETVDIDEDGDFISRQYDVDGKEIFGAGGPPKCRKALGFEYGNGFAVLLEGLRETDAALTTALQRIADLEAKLSA